MINNIKNIELIDNQDNIEELLLNEERKIAINEVLRNTKMGINTIFQ